jgi:hypothetical protein
VTLQHPHVPLRYETQCTPAQQALHREKQPSRGALCRGATVPTCAAGQCAQYQHSAGSRQAARGGPRRRTSRSWAASAAAHTAAAPRARSRWTPRRGPAPALGARGRGRPGGPASQPERYLGKRRPGATPAQQSALVLWEMHAAWAVRVARQRRHREGMTGAYGAPRPRGS